MTTPLTPPILSYDNIDLSAENFLKDHEVENELPVPIEEIIEFDLGIDIAPFPGCKYSVNPSRGTQYLPEGRGERIEPDGLLGERSRVVDIEFSASFGLPYIDSLCDHRSYVT